VDFVVSRGSDLSRGFTVYDRNFDIIVGWAALGRNFGLFKILYNDSVLPQRRHSISITTTNLFQQTITVYWENHTEHKDALT
jgi:hypothetical protein